MHSLCVVGRAWNCHGAKGQPSEWEGEDYPVLGCKKDFKGVTDISVEAKQANLLRKQGNNSIKN